MPKETIQFKRVPALDKGFAILDLLAREKTPLGVSDLANRLGYNKGTVYNIAHTLVDLKILVRLRDGRYQLGPKLCLLGRAADDNARLIAVVHPYLEDINRRTHLSAFLGIRSGLRAVIVDKVDTAFDIKIHSEIGMRIPLLAGAGGRVLLCQLTAGEIDRILSENRLKRFTPNSCVDRKAYREMIRKAGEEGMAVDDQEYIEGIRALAVPLRSGRADVQAAIWAVGLKRLLTPETIAVHSDYLKGIVREIENQLTL